MQVLREGREASSDIRGSGKPQFQEAGIKNEPSKSEGVGAVVVVVSIITVVVIIYSSFWHNSERKGRRASSKFPYQIKRT